MLVAIGLIALARSGDGVLVPPSPGVGAPAAAGDPFAYSAARQAQFEARAAAGEAHPLFTASPGGAPATAQRVAAYRSLIVAAARGSGIDPDALEAIVFVESAGRSGVVAGSDIAQAAGLTQILAGTGSTLLGMHIDLARSRLLSSQISRADKLGLASRVATLQALRAQADARFSPPKALAATVRYLQIARSHLGRSDLAIESYHMGIGNLQQVLGGYNGGSAVPYAQLFFDTAPNRHAAAYRLLSGFSDDSELYYWRVLEAEAVMRLYRTDPTALRRLSTLQTAYPSSAEALVPGDTYPQYSDPAALSAAYQRRGLVRLPRDPSRLGIAYAPSMGAEAAALKVPRTLYEGLRPAALALLTELAARVRAISGVPAPLVVAATVSDARYQSRLGVSDPPTSTGYTFQIRRRYASPSQALAFQAMLDRLQALGLIAWIRGPSTIEVTVAPDADAVIAHGV